MDLGGVHLQAIKHKANSFTDRVANEGTDGNDTLSSHTWQELSDGKLHRECEDLHRKDRDSNCS